ncbi:MAG: deoxyribonuclease IV [Pirellulales bacterium]|nr:deoxyribonuclease IV [Pirellulales bacterium]
MPILGAHMSIAGGYYKAVDAARACECDCVQVFTKNNNQWRAKPITDDDVRLFREALERTGVVAPLSHASYLINLAACEEIQRRKAIEGYVVEIERAAQLGIPGVVLHPGSPKGEQTDGDGIANIATALDEVHERTCDNIAAGAPVVTLLENTAGQGRNLGWRFEQLAAIRTAVNDPDRVGVCFDTCHAFAAGYAMETEEQYQQTLSKFDATVGLEHLRAFHLNDSKKPLGSRVDRHEHIGEGEMGLEPFRHLVNDERFAKTPMYLETAKEKRHGEEMDAVNLRTLRALIRSA